MIRTDGRTSQEMRPAEIIPGFLPHTEGSCLITMGNTKVICTVTVEDKAPIFTRGTGWVTAEYGVLPRATPKRTHREVMSGPSGQTMEIERLIARSLRAVVEMPVLGHRTLKVDCDVLQADGGTYCAAITGGYIAIAEACRKMVQAGVIHRMPLSAKVAAVRVGVVEQEVLLDPCSEEERFCHTSLNVIATEKGRYIELQGLGGLPFERKLLAQLLDIAHTGIQELTGLQKQILDEVTTT